MAKQKSQRKMAAINTFSKGMMQDLDKAQHSKETYRYSKNGRLIYKQDGSFAWTNVLGNKISFSITSGYQMRGACELPDKLVIFSYNDITGTSEIGLVKFSDNFDKIIATYTAIFNDTYDPNGDRLNFTNRIEAIPYPETSMDLANDWWIERVYWTDDLNEPRSLNIATWDWHIATYGQDILSLSLTQYPQWYSVHNIAFEPDMRMGFVEFNKVIKGNLSSGKYQYSYRLLTRDGKTTNWHPVTNKLSIVDADVDTVNWHKYRMKNINKVTAKGVELYVYINDDRFYKFEVAYVRYITDTAAIETKVFFKGKIGEGLLSGSSVIHLVNHTTLKGDIYTDDALVAFYTAIEKAKTIQIKEKTLLLGNYREREVPVLTEAKRQAVTVKPYFRTMRTDVEGMNAELPLTHQVPGDHEAWKVSYYDRTNSGLSANSLNIVNDYQNYKGMQVEMSFAGYFRGETYRIGILFYDKKGRPGFVQHLCDIRMPEIHGERWSDGSGAISQPWYEIMTIDENDTSTTTKYRMKNNDPGPNSMNISSYSWNVSYAGGTGDADPMLTNGTSFKEFPLYKSGSVSGYTGGWPNHSLPTDSPGGSTPQDNSRWMRILGLWIDDIDITDIKDKISGFSIVRAERDPRVIAQGLLMPTSYLYDPSGYVSTIFGGTDDHQKYTFPWPTLYHRTDGGSAGFGAYIYDHNAKTLKNQTPLTGAAQQLMLQRAKTFMLAMPDLLMGDTPSFSAQDRIRLVSTARSSFTGGSDLTDPSEHNMTRFNSAADTANHFHVKFYENWAPYTNKYYNGYSSINTYRLETDDIKSLTGPIGSGNKVSGYNPGSTELVFENRYMGYDAGTDTNPFAANRYYDGGAGGADWGQLKRHADDTYAYGHNNAYVVVLDKWGEFYHIKPFMDTGSVNSYLTYPIVEYYREGGGTYGGLNNNSLTHTFYQLVGEFTSTAPFEDTPERIKVTSGRENADTGLDYTSLNPGYIVDGRETWGGDCFNDIFSYSHLMPYYNYKAGDCTDPDYQTHPTVGGDKYFQDMAFGMHFPCECKFNHMLHLRDNYFGEVGFRAQTAADLATNDFFPEGLLVSEGSCVADKTESYNQSMASVVETLYLHKQRPIDFNIIRDFPYSWVWSYQKTLGEFYNNFVQIPIANKLDLESRYGEITCSAILGTKMISFQETGISQLSMNDRSTLTSDQGSILTIGSSGFMDKYLYLSTEFGNQHQYSLVKGKKSLYWVDALAGKIMSYGGKGLIPMSDVLGMHDYMETTTKEFIGRKNPGIIHSGFDHKNSDIMFSFISQRPETVGESSLRAEINDTLVYNENLSKFTTFLDVIPRYWFSYGDSFFSEYGATSNMYIYNENYESSFFGAYYDSQLEIIVNEMSHVSKTFDNLIMNVNSDGESLLKQIDMETESVTQALTPNTDTRSTYRELLFRTPLRNETSSERVRGKWMSLKFTFNNTGGKDILISNTETRYRPSRKI